MIPEWVAKEWKKIADELSVDQVSLLIEALREYRTRKKKRLPAGLSEEEAEAYLERQREAGRKSRQNIPKEKLSEQNRKASRARWDKVKKKNGGSK